MPNFEIIYKPGSSSDRAQIDTEVEADSYRVEGRFIRFFVTGEQYSPGQVMLTVSSADVLQIKEAPE